MSVNISLKDLIKYWESALPEKVSYADMVGATKCYGDMYVYPDEEGYFIEATIKILKKLL